MEHALTVMRNIGNVVHSFTEPPADNRTELDLGLKDQARPTQERHYKVLQEPITRSEHLPYLLLELSFLQTELFLERLSRQANNAFVY